MQKDSKDKCVALFQHANIELKHNATRVRDGRGGGGGEVGGGEGGWREGGRGEEGRWGGALPSGAHRAVQRRASMQLLRWGRKWWRGWALRCNGQPLSQTQPLWFRSDRTLYSRINPPPRQYVCVGGGVLCACTQKIIDTKWPLWILTLIVTCYVALLHAVVAAVRRQKFLSHICNTCLCFQRLHTLLPFISFWAFCNENPFVLSLISLLNSF